MTHLHHCSISCHLWVPPCRQIEMAYINVSKPAVRRSKPPHIRLCTTRTSFQLVCLIRRPCRHSETSHRERTNTVIKPWHVPCRGNRRACDYDPQSLSHWTPYRAASSSRISPKQIGDESTNLKLPHGIAAVKKHSLRRLFGQAERPGRVTCRIVALDTAR